MHFFWFCCCFLVLTLRFSCITCMQVLFLIPSFHSLILITEIFSNENLKYEFFILIIFKAPKIVRHAGKLSRSPRGLPQQSQSSQWDSIIKFLDSLMDRLRGNHVCAILFFSYQFHV